MTPRASGADFANCKSHADANSGRKNMKQLIFALLCSMGLVATANAATPEAELLAPIHQFIDNFNKGDAAAAEAANVPTGVIIVDEVPPHLWQGPGAFKAWAKDLDTHD